MGRPAVGVNAIRMDDGDELAGMDVIAPNDTSSDLLVITQLGYGKRTAVEEFRLQGRYGSGVRALGHDLERTGLVASAMVINGDYDLTAITLNGVALRTSIASINRYGRMAMGVSVMNMDDGDYIVSVTAVESGEGTQRRNGKPKADDALAEELEDNLPTDEPEAEG
jgi:DNA gyrase subunit A